MKFLRTRDQGDVGETQRRVAALFVEAAAEFEVVFDYSEGSIEDLEDWMNHLWDPNGRPPTDSQLDSHTKLVGAYLGELIIRHIGGQWIMAGDPRQPAVKMQSGRIAMVLTKAYKRQVNDGGESLVDFYVAAKRQRYDATGKSQ